MDPGQSRETKGGKPLTRPNWTWILVFLFVLSMLSYPIYEDLIGGWPLNFVLTVAVCVVYAILYAFYIQDRLNRED